MLIGVYEARLGFGAKVTVGGETAENSTGEVGSPDWALGGEISCCIVCDTRMSLE
jgi:hypothetical protein